MSDHQQFRKTDARLAALRLLASSTVGYYCVNMPGQFRSGKTETTPVSFKLGESLMDLVNEKLASIEGRYTFDRPGPVWITTEGRKTLGRWTTQRLTPGRAHLLRRVAFGEVSKVYDAELKISYVDRGRTRNGQDTKTFLWLERAGLIHCTGEPNAANLREGPMALRQPGRTWLEANPA